MTYFQRDLKEEDLSEKIKINFEKIESSNKKIIEKVYNTALNDKCLMDQIEKINQKSLIKIIKGTSKD